MGQVDKKVTSDIPYMTVQMGYETFGGSGWCKYRFPIRAGKIPFPEMDASILTAFLQRGVLRSQR